MQINMYTKEIVTIAFIFVVFVSIQQSESTNIEVALECPYNSNGIHPFCRCKSGVDYNMIENSCPMPECPTTNSTGTYPDCNCTQRNFEYSATFNLCFRVCPDDSTGYWPNCKCDEDKFFLKKDLKCVHCPPESTGSYPNCDCNKVGQYFQNENMCVECPENTFGIFPNCTCQNDKQIFFLKTNFFGKCYNCRVLQQPNCICDDGGFFDGNSCQYCSGGSEGSYPDCVCRNNGTYVKNRNLCKLCGVGSVGIYPDCKCEDEMMQYKEYSNSCRVCPVKSTGIYPDCECPGGLFIKDDNICIDAECPIDTPGIFPNCECEIKTYEYSAFIDRCYDPCPINAAGIHPLCKCDNREDNYYDSDERICKSNIGRKCPEDAIGVGPDCLCMREHRTFFWNRWKCVNKLIGVSYSDVFEGDCPDTNKKWPQCGSSIRSFVLASLIG